MKWDQAEKQIPELNIIKKILMKDDYRNGTEHVIDSHLDGQLSVWNDLIMVLPRGMRLSDEFYPGILWFYWKKYKTCITYLNLL